MFKFESSLLTKNNKLKNKEKNGKRRLARINAEVLIFYEFLEWFLRKTFSLTEIIKANYVFRNPEKCIDALSSKVQCSICKSMSMSVVMF